jgi:hypothetical protein
MAAALILSGEEQRLTPTMFLQGAFLLRYVGSTVCTLFFPGAQASPGGGSE